MTQEEKDDEELQQTIRYSKFIDHIIELEKDEADLISWSLSRFKKKKENNTSEETSS